MASHVTPFSVCKGYVIWPHPVVDTFCLRCHLALFHSFVLLLFFLLPLLWAVGVRIKIAKAQRSKPSDLVYIYI